MRIAERKFYQSGECKTHGKALERFLKENVLAHGPCEEWKDWRTNVWWTYENHKILHINLPGLKKLYQSYFKPRHKFMDKNDCIDLMTRYSKLIPDENKVIYCFGMSKMALI